MWQIYNDPAPVAGVAYLFSGRPISRLFWMAAVLSAATGSHSWFLSYSLLYVRLTFFLLLPQVHILRFYLSLSYMCVILCMIESLRRTIAGNLKCVLLENLQRLFSDSSGAAFFSYSIFADWQADPTVTSLSSAVSSVFAFVQIQQNPLVVITRL